MTQASPLLPRSLSDDSWCSMSMNSFNSTQFNFPFAAHEITQGFRSVLFPLPTWTSRIAVRNGLIGNIVQWPRLMHLPCSTSSPYTLGSPLEFCQISSAPRLFHYKLPARSPKAAHSRNPERYRSCSLDHNSRLNYRELRGLVIFPFFACFRIFWEFIFFNHCNRQSKFLHTIRIQRLLYLYSV